MTVHQKIMYKCLLKKERFPYWFLNSKYIESHSVSNPSIEASLKSTLNEIEKRFNHLLRTDIDRLIRI